MRRPYRDMEERLICNSVLDEDTGCWIWIGHRSPAGYGKINVRINGKTKSVWAHRVSYETFIGPIPDGFTLDHGCNCTSCIHPNHTIPVPRHENTKRQWDRNGRRKRSAQRA